jgi:MFS family permease
VTQSSEPAGPTAATADGDWQSRPDVVAIQRRSVRLLIISQILGSFGMGAAPSVGILLAEEIAGSEAMAGLARTSSTLGAALVGIPLAMLAARGGRRIALATGWFMAAFGSITLIGAAMVSSTLLLVAGMLFFGVGTASMLQARFAAADLAAPAHRGRTLSLVVWCGTLGSVFGPNLGRPGELVSARLGLPPLAGAFVIALVMLIIAGVVLLIFLRPDPLLTATRFETPDGKREKRPIGEVIRILLGIPLARFALVAVIAAHLSMVSLMTMTPVHMDHHAAGVTLIGITISIHVLGMFAFSPLVGWASDKIGPIRVIMAGQLIFIGSSVAVLLSGGANGGTMISLFLLGLGWSCGTVPGSILMTEAVPADIRPSSQGLVDTAMNGFAALAALISGPLFVTIGFGGLSLMAIVVAVPVLTYAIRMDRRPIVPVN